jgi:4-hydroxybutyrate dehydrogenase/sulfolactaldehyde 3-reductase
MTKMTSTSQENVMAVIAFIGLGQMGSPMASNLLKQGHQLSVFDVNPDAVQRLVEKGHNLPVARLRQ